MSFDWEKTKAAMIAVGSKVAGKQVQLVEIALHDALVEERQAFQDIVQARLNGELTDAEMQTQLDHERRALSVAMAVVDGMGKLAIQRTVNAVVDVFWAAVDAALPGGHPKGGG